MTLNIAVCVKPVPDPNYYNTIEMDPVTKTMIRKGIPTVINPLDKHALEAALTIRQKFGGKVSIFSMAPPDVVDTLRQGLAMGADEAYLLSDRAFGGADSLATSYTLSCGIQKAGKYDLVLLGNESADGATSHVPAQLGEWLGMAHLMNVDKLELEDDGAALARMKTETGFIEYRVKLPAVIAVRREINTPRFIGLKGIVAAKKKKIEVWGVSELNPDKTKIGLGGSPSQPGDMFVPETGRKGEELTGTPEEIVEQLIRRLRVAGVNIPERSGA